MRNDRARWFVLLLLAGCSQNQTVSENIDQSMAVTALPANAVPNPEGDSQDSDQPESRELAFVRTCELEFIHEVLRQKVERIDRLAREQGLPAENTMEWKLRPPSVNDNRKLHDYVAQWSSHNAKFGSLQPDQRPGTQVFVMVEVDPANTKLIRSFSLFANSQSVNGGWDTYISLFSQPYRSDRLGEEVLRFALCRSDEIAFAKWIEWPFLSWYTNLTEETGNPLGQEIAVRTELPKLGLEQMREALASAETFRDEMRRELGAAKRLLLDDIAASRNVRIFTLAYADSIHSPVPTVRVESDPPAGLRLTKQQKRKLSDNATAEIDERIALFSKEYKKMYAAIVQAFPIEKYLAAGKTAPRRVGADH